MNKLAVSLLFVFALILAGPALADWQSQCDADHEWCLADCAEFGPPAPGCTSQCNDSYMECMWAEDGDYCPTVYWCPRPTLTTPPPSEGG